MAKPTPHRNRNRLAGKEFTAAAQGARDTWRQASGILRHLAAGYQADGHTEIAKAYAATAQMFDEYRAGLEAEYRAIAGRDLP